MTTAGEPTNESRPLSSGRSRLPHPGGLTPSERTRRLTRFGDWPLRMQVLFPLATLAAGAVLIAELAIVPNAYDTATLAVIIGSTVGLIVVGLWLGQRVSRRLRELVEATERLAAGDLEHRVSVTSRDELGSLASAFNRLADQIGVSRSDLETRVATRTRDLEGRTRQLIDALADLRAAHGRLENAASERMRFVADVAHEVRTPVASVLLASDLLRDPATPLDASVTVEVAEQIHSSCRHLLLVLDDLTDLARLDSGNLSIHASDVAVEEIVREVARIAEPLAEQRQVSFASRSASDEPLVVRADPVRARQVLLNLITNALKASPPGTEVRLETSADRTRVHFEVIDTAGGISPDELERIFLPFEQGNSAAGGVGLGLTIARRISELMDGSLTVSSTPGLGSNFRVSLPRSSRAHAHRSPDTATGPDQPSPEVDPPAEATDPAPLANPSSTRMSWE